MRKSGRTIVELLVAVCIVAIVVVALIVPIIGYFGGFYADYSDGVRVGELYKVSQRGLIWKSWECELKLSDFGLRGKGSGDNWNNVFAFSTRDPEIGKKLERLAGRRVSVFYTQWFCKPISQDSAYTAIKVIPMMPGEKSSEIDLTNP